MAPREGGDELEALAHRAAAGDGDAFAALARALVPDWYRIASHLLDDPVAADDAVHEVTLKVYSALRQWNGDARVRTWTYRIAINTCHDARRRAQRSALREVSLDRALDLPATSAGGTMSDDPLARDMVARAVAQLPRELAEVVSLRYGAALGFAEIAGVLGVPQGTVSTRLRRALSLLATILEPTFGRD